MGAWRQNVHLKTFNNWNEYQLVMWCGTRLYPQFKIIAGVVRRHVCTCLFLTDANGVVHPIQRHPVKVVRRVLVPSTQSVLEVAWERCARRKKRRKTEPVGRFSSVRPAITCEGSENKENDNNNNKRTYRKKMLYFHSIFSKHSIKIIKSEQTKLVKL